MISEIRDYFKQVISEIDSDLKEHSSPVNSDNIDGLNIEDTYFISIGEMRSNREDTTILSEINVSVSVFESGLSDEINRYDSGYCKALDIQALSMYQGRISQTDFLKSVESNAILPETVDSNDNLYKFTIQFTVRLEYEWINS